MSHAEFTVYVRQTSCTHPLPSNSTLRVGRGSRVHIRVDDPSVSREHLLLHVSSEGIQIEDLGSSNGTQLFPGSKKSAGRLSDKASEVKLEPGKRYPIAPGDMLRIGSVPALLQQEEEATTPSMSTNPPPSRASDQRILVDPEMKRVYELAARAARSEIGVLITGETGVGKELLAAAVHENSRRSSHAFLQLNCAALAENLLESELFGHEKGAFTGAHATRAGLLEATRGGTVFLDEIGEMPLSTQAKLLRVLEERLIRRLGSSRSIPIDVRFVAATNRDLSQEVASGRFRGDLYYRISGISLRIPPLRERPSEIEPLARHFLADFCLKSGIAVPEITQAALQAMLEYAWPGNVRELKNAMERAPFLSAGAPLLPEHIPSSDRAPMDEDFADEQTDLVMTAEHYGSSFRLPDHDTAPFRRMLGFGTAEPRGWEQPTTPSFLPAGGASVPSDRAASWRPSSRAPSVRPPSLVPLAHGNSREFSEDEERKRVVAALERCGGNQTRAAKLLGVSRRTLINRLDALDIPRPRKQGG